MIVTTLEEKSQFESILRGVIILILIFHTEPHLCKPEVCFQSLSDVFKALKLERQSLTCASEDTQAFLCNTCEFTEKMRSEVPSATHRRVEDFEKLPLEDVECEEPLIKSPCSLDMCKMCMCFSGTACKQHETVRVMNVICTYSNNMIIYSLTADSSTKIVCINFAFMLHMVYLKLQLFRFLTSCLPCS